MGFGQEDLSELEGRGFDQLDVPAVGRTLFGVPADERRPVAQGVALEVVEGPFHDLFRPEGLPGQASPPIPAGRRPARPLARGRHLPAQVAQPAPGWFSRALSRRGANSAIRSDRRAIVSEAVMMRLGFTTAPRGKKECDARVEGEVERFANATEALGRQSPEYKPGHQRDRPGLERRAGAFAVGVFRRAGPTAVATARVALRSLAAALERTRAFRSSRLLTASGPASRNSRSISVQRSSAARGAPAARSFASTAS